LHEQPEKIIESKTKGHCKRLEQRQQRLGKIETEINQLEKKSQKISVQLEKLEEPSVRADRDFRKQSIISRSKTFIPTEKA